MALAAMRATRTVTTTVAASPAICSPSFSMSVVPEPPTAAAASMPAYPAYTYMKTPGMMKAMLERQHGQNRMALTPNR